MIESRAPENYVCPICLGIQESDNEATLMRSTDIVYKDDLVTGFINSFFVGNNPGHVIVVPNQHYENLYTLPSQEGYRLFDVAKKVALAMKEVYQCDGVTTRQNNEPAGDQHAFHFHFHIFPRYDDDGFNAVQPADKRLADPSERADYARKLGTVLEV
jgi:histidine triad (HIT) family protein